MEEEAATIFKQWRKRLKKYLNYGRRGCKNEWKMKLRVEKYAEEWLTREGGWGGGGVTQFQFPVPLRKVSFFIGTCNSIFCAFLYLFISIFLSLYHHHYM